MGQILKIRALIKSVCLIVVYKSNICSAWVWQKVVMLKKCSFLIITWYVSP